MLGEGLADADPELVGRGLAEAEPEAEAEAEADADAEALDEGVCAIVQTVPKRSRNSLFILQGIKK